jgi:hypothetical protein
MRKKIILSVLLLFTAPAYADILYMNDGTAHIGTVVKVTDSHVVFYSDEESRVLQIEKGSVKSIRYENGQTVTLNGESETQHSEQTVDTEQAQKNRFDQIVLKDGRRIPGKIVKETDTVIKFITQPDGKPTDIFLKDISMIIYADRGEVDSLKEEPEKKDNTPEKEKLAENPSSEKIKTHVGFYFRLLAGFGYGYHSVGMNDKISIKGPLFGGEIDCGYTVFENTIVYAGWRYNLIRGNKNKQGNTSLSGIQKVYLDDLTLGCTYYFMPSNIYMSASISSHLTHYKGNILNGDSSRGLGFSFALGKEFCTTDLWGTGVALVGSYGRGKIKASSANSFATRSYSLGIMISATYN